MLVVFPCCRQGQEAAQRVLFQKAKFASFLIENFVPFDQDDVDADAAPSAAAAAAGNGSGAEQSNNSIAANDLRSRRIAARGVIMNCANAIRLQVSTQAPSSFLHNFLNAHPKWNEFIPLLKVNPLTAARLCIYPAIVALLFVY